MNALVTALPDLVPIFVLAGGVNALAGVLFLIKFLMIRIRDQRPQNNAGAGCILLSENALNESLRVQAAYARSILNQPDASSRKVNLPEHETT